MSNLQGVQVDAAWRRLQAGCRVQLGLVLLALLVALGAATLLPGQSVRAAQQLGNQIGVGLQPFAVAANPVTNRIYVTNEGSHSVSVLDGLSNLRLGAISLGAGTSPRGVTIDTVINRIYVANSGANTVTVIDGAAGAFGAVSATITAGIGTTPHGIAVNPFSNKLYVTNRDSNSVSIINTTNHAPITVLPVGVQPVAVAVWPFANSSAVVANYGSGTVSTISSSDAVATTPIDVPGNPVAVAPYACGGRFFVPSANTNVISIVDPQSQLLYDSITTPANSVAFDCRIWHAYATNPINDTLVTIDVRKKTVVGSPLRLNAGGAPSGVAVNPTTGLVYVANRGNNTVTVVGVPRFAERVIGGPIPIGSFSLGLAVNPTNNRIYVPDADDHAVTVIDGSTNTAMGSPIPVGFGPVAVAVNPITNRVYVINATDRTVSVIDSVTNTVIGEPIRLRIRPISIAVNSTTDRVYVGGENSDGIEVIDGATNIVIGAPIAVAPRPRTIGVNPSTNRIYVAHGEVPLVTVIDGVTNAPHGAPINVPGWSWEIAVDATTNRIYVTHPLAQKISMIDGATHAVGDVPIPMLFQPHYLATNPRTNRSYVTEGDLWAIDGATSSVIEPHLDLGDSYVISPVAVNPATGRFYVRSGYATLQAFGSEFAASPQVTQAGGAVQVTFGSLIGSSSNDRIGLFAQNAPNNAPIVARFSSGSESAGAGAPTSGAVTLPIPGNQAPGSYEVRFVSGHTGQTLAAVVVRVAGPPVANNDSYTFVSGAGPYTRDAAAGVLANDNSDGALQASVVNGPTQGTLNLQPNGGFTYALHGNAGETDTFTYRATDPQGRSSTATVSIAILPATCGQRPPVTVTTATADGALQATIVATSANGSSQTPIQRIAFGTFQNAQVTLNGHAVSSGQTVQLPANTTSLTLTVRRQVAGQTTTVPFTVFDACGAWPSFVGGGPGAGF